VEVGNDKDLASCLQRAPVSHHDDALRVTYSKLSARAFYLDKIRVDARQGSATCVAFTAATGRAQKRGGEPAHELALLQARRAGEQIRVNGVNRCGQQLSLQFGLSCYALEQRR
jgi:hypothetical protein